MFTPVPQPEETGISRLGNALKNLGDSLSSFTMFEDSDDDDSDTEDEEEMVTGKVDHRYNRVVQAWKKKFAYQDKDIEALLDQQSFQDLKKSLRKRGFVTNNYLQQNLHHYVYHLKSKDERNAAKVSRWKHEQ